MFETGFEQLVEAVGVIRCSGVPADARSLVAMRGQLDALHALVAEAEVRFDAAELWRDEGAARCGRYPVRHGSVGSLC